MEVLLYLHLITTAGLTFYTWFKLFQWCRKYGKKKPISKVSTEAVSVTYKTKSKDN